MNVIEEIKKRQGIVEIAKHLIPKLKKSSNRYVGTIRGEKTPALTIYPKTQSWFHFAGDTTPKGKQGGDVIDLIEYVNDCDTTEAIKFLVGVFGIPYKPLSNEEKRLIEEQRLTQNILLFAANFYHNKLYQSEGEKYRQYLYDRGLNDNLIRNNLIGIAEENQELLNYLKKAKFSLEEIQRTGLIIKNGYGFFQKRITFPLFKDGSVVYMTGRKTADTPENKWEQGKYKHLPVNKWIKNDYFYNEDVLNGSQEVVICEGIPNCLTLKQWGFKAMGLLGNCLKDELAKKLNHLKKIYIAVDTDGKTDPVKIAEVIGNKARIAILPKGKEDINDLAISGKLTKEIFQKLLDESRSLIECQLPSDLKDYQVEIDKLGEVQISKDDFKYQISQIIERKEGLRAVITLSRKGKKLNRDRILLVSGKSRKTFANNCGVDKKDNQRIKQDLMNIEEILSFVSSKKIEADGVKGKVLTKQERDEALKILKSPTLLYDIKSLFPRLLIAREEKNCLLIYLSATSRIVDSPISLIGKGDSSVGKSYIVGKILKLFPKDSCADITYATSKSFYHADKDAYKHKIILLIEKPGTEQSDYSIRVLQSEKKLSIQIPVKDPQTGEFKTEIKEVEGPVVFITTTTSPQIQIENETRCFSFYGDESEQQSLNTFEMTDSKYRGIEEILEKELKKFKNIQTLLKPYPVLIPYVEEIRTRFPKKPTRVRRDYGRILALIEVVTLLHQLQRKKREINGKEYLVSTLCDYYIAKIIGENILKYIIFELPPQSKNLVKDAKKLLKEKEAQEEDLVFTIRELSRKLDIDYDTTHKWFRPAFEKGYFERKEEHKGSKAAKYALLNKEIKNREILPSLKELVKKYSEGKEKIYDPITGEKIKP